MLHLKYLWNIWLEFDGIIDELDRKEGRAGGREGGEGGKKEE